MRASLAASFRQKNIHDQAPLSRTPSTARKINQMKFAIRIVPNDGEFSIRRCHLVVLELAAYTTTTGRSDSPGSIYPESDIISERRMKVRVVWKSGSFLGRRQVADPDAPPRALVDVHSHILWGLEYGLINLDQSVAMLMVAAKYGTTDIVATPRASLEDQFDPEITAQILKKLRARTDGLIGIHMGCDFHMGYSNVSDVLADPRKYAINGLNYLLVDFANTLIPPPTEEILSQFTKEGLIPIICHPERNPILQDSIERLKAWISMGCVLQVTAQSLSGHFGKAEQRFAWELLRDGMVYVIASDARDLHHNPPRLDGAWRLVKKKLGEDAARKLFIDNPSMVIRGGAQGRKSAIAVALDPEVAVG